MTYLNLKNLKLQMQFNKKIKLKLITIKPKIEILKFKF